MTCSHSFVKVIQQTHQSFQNSVYYNTNHNGFTGSSCDNAQFVLATIVYWTENYLQMSVKYNEWIGTALNGIFYKLSLK